MHYRTLLGLFFCVVTCLQAQTLFVPGSVGASTVAGNVGIGTSAPAAALQVTTNVGNQAFKVGISNNAANSNAEILSSIAAVATNSSVLSVSGAVATDYYNAGVNPSWSGTLLLYHGRSYPGSGFGIPYSNLGEICFQNESAGVIDTNGPNPIYLAPAGGISVTLTPTGSVGIGTTTPGTETAVDGDKLDIEGGYMRLGYSNGPFLNFYHPNAGPDLKFTRIGMVNGDMYFDSVNDAYNNAPTRLFIQNTTGNIGIGTITPTQKLSVNGAIRAKEVIVDTSWSDYVFADDYKLASLNEVERHIKAEHHLPGIPSATEVAKKGISVGEMQARLLAKVEELTLHLIAQEKKMVEQQSKIERLETELANARNLK